ncbi:MAG: single-stranded-DNA-specific exonuclease RecJ [Limnochordia bacterium]
MIDRLWRIRSADTDLEEAFSRQLGVRSVTARVLAARGAQTLEAARLMLDADLGELHSPWELPDMDRAVRRLQLAYARGEKVSVYGDYDADGQTGAAIVVIGLRRLGMNVDYYIPHRLDEGYGLHAAALASLAGSGTTLLITVDCGTTSAVEVSQAQEAGMDCIVTDHHEMTGYVVPAVAVINPRLPQARYPWSHLSGVGVAYKLMCAFGESLGRADLVADLEDLVAFGTIADVVPLQDENRVLVYRGLKRLNTSPLPGLAALAAVSQCAPGMIEAYHVAFQMAPRLNAIGRMADASVGMEMLLASNMERALPLAMQLDQANRERQEEEERVLAQARSAAEALDNPVLVIAGQDWHPGVLGIVASRLVEQYGRPTLVLTREGDEVTGSGRSVSGFHITEALEASEHLLIRYGGHAMAAGMTLPVANLGELQRVLDQEAIRQLGSDGRALQVLNIDALAEPDELDEALLTELDRLGPFGCGNPSPVLAWTSVVPREVRVVGKGCRHLRLSLPMGRSQIVAVGFRLGHKASIAAANSLDIAFSLTINEWQGRRSLELRLRDLRSSEPTGVDEVAAAGETDAETDREMACIDARSARSECSEYMADMVRRGLSTVLWVRHNPDRFAQTEALVLCPETEAIRQPSTPWGLVLYDPPVAEDWLRVWRQLTVESLPAEVHILYGTRETARAAALLDEDWPERAGLVQAYRHIQCLRQSGQSIDPQSLAAYCGLSLSGAMCALRVFAELNLVKQDGESWIPMPKPDGKLDLTWAVSYNEYMAKRRAACELLSSRQFCGAVSQWLRLFTNSMSGSQ